MGAVVLPLHLGEKCLRFNEFLLSLPSAISLLSSHSQFLCLLFWQPWPILALTHKIRSGRGGGGGGGGSGGGGGGLYIGIKQPAYKTTIYYRCHWNAQGTQSEAHHSRLLKKEIIEADRKF